MKYDIPIPWFFNSERPVFVIAVPVGADRVRLNPSCRLVNDVFCVFVNIFIITVKYRS